MYDDSVGFALCVTAHYLINLMDFFRCARFVVVDGMDVYASVDLDIGQAARNA